MMANGMEEMYKYNGYIKCGEILRPPSESTTRPYALKCFHCQEIYLLFEAFIFHIEDHCKNTIAKMEHDSNDKIPFSIVQDNKTYLNEEDKNCSFIITELPSIVIKSENTSDSSKHLLFNEDFNTTDSSTALRSETHLSTSHVNTNLSDDEEFTIGDMKTDSSSPFQSDSQLNIADEKLNGNSNKKKLPYQRKVLEKCTNNTAKATKVGIDNIKNIKNKPGIKIININKIGGLTLKYYDKRVKKPSNIINYKKIDDNCKSYQKDMEDETKHKADENLPRSDDDVIEIDIEAFGNTYG